MKWSFLKALQAVKIYRNLDYFFLCKHLLSKFWWKHLQKFTRTKLKFYVSWTPQIIENDKALSIIAIFSRILFGKKKWWNFLKVGSRFKFLEAELKRLVEIEELVVVSNAPIHFPIIFTSRLKSCVPTANIPRSWGFFGNLNPFWNFSGHLFQKCRNWFLPI